MLLVIAMLFTRSMANAQRVNLGFKADGLVNLTMDPTGIGYDHEQAKQFYDQVLAQVRALPESNRPALLSPSRWDTSVRSRSSISTATRLPPDRECRPSWTITFRPDYLQNMGIPLLRGREFTDADKADTNYVAVINQAAAEKFWPNQDPIGRHFKMKDDKKQRSVEVVGIAQNSRYDDLSGPGRSVPLYSLCAALRFFFDHDVASAGANVSGLAHTLEETIGGIAPALPVFNIQTMTQGLDTLNGFLIYKLGAALAAIMGLLGLVLAIVGRLRRYLLRDKPTYARNRHSRGARGTARSGGETYSAAGPIDRGHRYRCWLGLRAGRRPRGWPIPGWRGRQRSIHLHFGVRDSHGSGLVRLLGSCASRDACGSRYRATPRIAYVERHHA